MLFVTYVISNFTFFWFSFIGFAANRLGGFNVELVFRTSNNLNQDHRMNILIQFVTGKLQCYNLSYTCCRADLTVVILDLKTEFDIPDKCSSAFSKIPTNRGEDASVSAQPPAIGLRWAAATTSKANKATTATDFIVKSQLVKRN